MSPMKIVAIGTRRTPKKIPAELEAESDALLAAHNTGGKKLARPVDSIRPDMRGFKPFDEMPGEGVRAA